MNPRSRRVDTRVWWWLGHVLDIVHMPLVIALVLLGANAFPGTTYATIVAAVVILQVALLACPVMALSGYLKRLHDPSFENNWSFTMWLYRHYGRWVGVAVFVFFLAVALVVRQLWV